MGDFLGTGRIAVTLREYIPFKKALKFARKLNLKGKSEWGNFCKSGKLPNNVPGDPRRTYLNKGWISWGDFLGTGRIASRLQSKTYRSFKKARSYIQKFKLTKEEEYRKLHNKKKLPKDMPLWPGHNYKNKGWKGYRDFLGYKYVPQIYRPFKEARAYIRKYKFKSDKGIKKLYHSGKLPKDIPSKPRRIYANKGWISMGDFLGKSYLNFKNARSYVRKLKLKSSEEYVKHYRSDKLPDNIPKRPQRNYKSKWKGWGDFLGTGFVAPSLRKYRSFKEVKSYVQKLKLKSSKGWVEHTKSERFPKDIPAHPRGTYKNKGWKGWEDFLGTG
jgi:hypothetical protein